MLAPDNKRWTATIAAIVDEAIISRRSVRAFLPDPVDEATVRDILDGRGARAVGHQHAALARLCRHRRGQGTSIADAMLNSGHPRRKGQVGRVQILSRPVLRALSTRGAARSASRSTVPRHRQARRRPDARAARPQLRLLRRAGRHDLHHRPPPEPGLVDRLRHVPAEHHDRGAGEGAAHLPAGGLRALSQPDPAGARHSATRKSWSAAWRSATRTRRSRKTTCAPTARRSRNG